LDLAIRFSSRPRASSTASAITTWKAATSVPVAHHGLLLALPFVVPALTIAFGIAAIAVRDRLRHRGS
jgi:hypothetical protein